MGVLSLNDRARIAFESLVKRASDFGVAPTRVGAATVVDAGIDVPGSLDAGVMMARVCMADLGSAQITPGNVGSVPVPAVAVNIAHAVPACMASQYAGWQITGDDYFAMGSGPMRAAYGKEELFDDIGFREKPTVGVGVLESDALPTGDVVNDMARKIGVKPQQLYLVVAPTNSLAGGVQVVARSVETALHKLHELKFNIKRVVGGYGCAPLPPVAKNSMKAIGRTNDAVLYGGEVTLFVTGDDESIREAGEKLPSSASRDYGRPFGEVFKSYDYDFYKVDRMLFSPACVVMQNIDTGKAHVFGKVNHDVLGESFFG